MCGLPLAAAAQGGACEAVPARGLLTLQAAEGCTTCPPAGLWPPLPASAEPAAVHIRLAREDDASVAVQVAATGSAPLTLAAWWAVLDDGDGARVSRYAQRPAWPSGDGPQRFAIEAPRRSAGGKTARLLFVVTDASSGAPLRAVQLSC